MKALKRILMESKGAKQVPTENEPQPPKKYRNASRLTHPYKCRDTNESAAKIIAEGALRPRVGPPSGARTRWSEGRMAATRAFAYHDAPAEKHVRSHGARADGFSALFSHKGSSRKDTDYQPPHLWHNVMPTEPMIPPQNGVQVDGLGMRTETPDGLHRCSAYNFAQLTDVGISSLSTQADTVIEPLMQKCTLSDTKPACLPARTQAHGKPSVSSVVPTSGVARKSSGPPWDLKADSGTQDDECESTTAKGVASTNSDHVSDLYRPAAHRTYASSRFSIARDHDLGKASSGKPIALSHWSDCSLTNSSWYEPCGNGDATMDSEDSLREFIRTQWKYLPANPQYASESVTKARRMLLVEWMMQVHSEHHMQCETLFHAIGCFDRYFSIVEGGLPIPANFLQLVGLCCLVIAAKFQETSSTLPHMSRWRSYLTRPYTTADILAAEIDILETLEFRIAPSNPALFLRNVSLECGVSLTSQLFVLSQFYLEATLLDSTYLSVLPEERAFIAFDCALRHSASNSYLVTKDRFSVALKKRMPRFTIELSKWSDALKAHVQQWQPTFLIAKFSTD